VICTLLWLALLTHAPAQEPAEPTQRAAQLVQQAVLTYPPEALAEGVSGDVVVRVQIDPTGLVTSATFVSGPAVFEAESVHAAESLRFLPALRDGEPVPTTLLVHFHFAPPDPVDEHADEEAIEVVVQAAGDDRTDTHAHTTLDEADLARSAGADLAETVSEVPGVTLARGSADTSKPIIRGHTERRLLILNDGVRHESQKWGADHAPEVDPFTAGRVEVVRGAAGVRYGPDAIGGVLLVEPPAMPRERGVGGRALLTADSNGWRPYGALRVDLAPSRTVSLRVEGSYARGADLRTPDYVLANTASETWNLGATMQLHHNDRQLRLTWHHHELRAGIFQGVRNATPAELLAQLEAGAPVGAEGWTQRYVIERAYQQVSHDQVSARGSTPLGAWGSLQVLYAYQHNHRQEFEQARDSVTGPQYDFTLRTHSLDAQLRHHAHLDRVGNLEGGLGVQGLFQENVYRGLSLLPGYRSLSFGLFGYERLSWQRGAVELGARYDTLGRTAFLPERDYEAHQRRGTLDATDCEPGASTARCARAWHTGSVSLGALWQLAPDALDLKLDLSSASRFPNADELYLVGSAPSFPVFAMGAPDLKTETTWGASPTLALRTLWIEAEASGYLNYVHNYVYFAPELAEDGTPRVDVTARGAFPRWTYRPVEALFYGFDGSLSIAPSWYVGLDLQAAIVRAQDTSDGQHLVGIPADRGALTLVVRPPSVGRLVEPWLRVRADLVARQFLVDPSQDLAPAPDGYALLGLSIGADVDLGRTQLRLGVDAHNLTNARYREYTSLMRYYADEPGVNVRARVGVGF
jgi:iron complex outermembrane receptor protein